MDSPENIKKADSFLNLIRSSKKGKFKIYIGLAAGVGKSYKMLEEAHKLLKSGVDVRIGYIETHGRVETERLVAGLPIIPRKRLFYKGHSLEEMDIDAVLNAHPEVVIVDELAHTNVQGSKNEKRWKDVLEILDAGINVIAAVNIQHIESLNNVVQKVTGLEVTERVPDSVIRSADEVVNIDLTIDELHQRLKEGKIYAMEKVDSALRNFFQKENLMQLRELALREVANQVERKFDTELTSKGHKSNDRFLCCISTNYEISKLSIRKAARLANRFDAEWFVLYVQTEAESSDNINLASQRHLINNFQLATEMGATVHRVKGNDIVKEIVAFAKEKNVTLVICGVSDPGILEKLKGKNITRDLVKAFQGTETDIFIVN